jgi:hypothetical protein
MIVTNILAKFIGINSLRFENNKFYKFRFKLHGLCEIRIETHSYGNMKSLICDYNNWDSFIRNWEISEIEAFNFEYPFFPPHDAIIGLKTEYRNLKINKILN